MEAFAREMLSDVSMFLRVKRFQTFHCFCARNIFRCFAALARETFSNVSLLLLTLSPDCPDPLDRQRCPSPRRSSLVTPWSMRSRSCRGMPRAVQPASVCSACMRAVTKSRSARMAATGKGRPKSKCSPHRSTRTSTAAITNLSTPSHGRSTKTCQKPTRSNTSRARSSRPICCIGT